MPSIELYPQKKVPAYPISKSGKQCIGPCYPANTSLVHPETGRYHINPTDSVCPIMPQPVNSYGAVTVLDPCYYKPGSDKKLNVSVEVGMNMQYSQFLKLYYKIYNFDDTLVWLDKNKNATTYTKERIIESSLFSFKNTIQYIDDILVNVYISIIKDLWIESMYRMLNNFIIIENGFISMKKLTKLDIETKKKNLFSTDVSANDPLANIKLDYLMQKFCNPKFVHNFLKKVIIKTEADVNIKKSFFTYIISKLPVIDE